LIHFNKSLGCRSSFTAWSKHDIPISSSSSHLNDPSSEASIVHERSTHELMIAGRALEIVKLVHDLHTIPICNAKCPLYPLTPKSSPIVIYGDLHPVKPRSELGTVRSWDPGRGRGYRVLHISYHLIFFMLESNHQPSSHDDDSLYIPALLVKCYPVSHLRTDQ